MSEEREYSPNQLKAIEEAEKAGQLGRAIRLRNLAKPWQPGHTGNPEGRPKRKPFEEEIIRLGTKERLEKVALKAWKMAEEGNMDAIRFVAQYIDDTKTMEKASLQFLANNVVIT